LKLGLLETGAPPRALSPRFGDYPAMFRRLLGEDAYDYTTWRVDAGELPDRAEACDAYLVTGSSAGVYDPLPWIGQLKDFLVAAKGRAALVGVCFGHQVMAEAFGGRVIKSSKGWGVGLQSYAVSHSEPWMDPADRIRIAASHQDQVVEAPPGAEVLAASDFTPFAMLAYRDQPAISLQPHPEFEPDYAKALIRGRSGDRFPADVADPAIRSLDQPNDRVRVGGWIKAFLAGATGP
jgi:GMP synthase-like glutamine amidotransferase